MAVHARTPQLTERQRLVVVHVRQGYSNREIGEKLGISEDGVKAHLSRLYLRYGVTNRVELISSVDETAGRPSTIVSRSPETPRAHTNGTPAVAPMLANGPTAIAAAKLSAVRDALLAVDAALGLVSELPPETTEPMISAVKRRLGGAIAALDDAQRAVTTSADGSAAI
ncbi:MAG TPA: LuxR C-terminal-related transcriptional regulator [Candidatus Limnocylindria bacterium]